MLSPLLYDEMHYRPLGNTGMNVSILGLGTAPFGGAYGGFEQADATRAVRLALDNGINILDTSPYYGETKSETVLGKALEGIPRERYFLSTKLGRYGLEDFDFSAERVARSMDESLARLGVEYVDILLCHDIEFVSLEQIINETLPAVYKIQAQGKARFVGVSGLPLKIFPTILDRAQLDVILSYCHYCLNDSSLELLVPYLQEKQVGIMNAAATGMGLLTESGPPSWHPASNEIKAACAQAAQYCRARGVNIVQLAIQYAMANPNFATTFIGSAHPDEMLNNIRWAQEPLDEQLLAEVEKILAPIHNLSWASGRPENN
jgi:L-galactose dehydrogenase